jgi:choline dehydrogenase-like flavoprotein
MLPREDGGVVDPNLKVYGTANLRAIDASVIPLMVQGNIQTAVYAVAEKGADLVETT